jgi:hypothetical protein
MENCAREPKGRPGFLFSRLPEAMSYASNAAKKRLRDVMVAPALVLFLI